MATPVRRRRAFLSALGVAVTGSLALGAVPPLHALEASAADPAPQTRSVPADPEPPAARPNIVVVTTDDQRRDDLRWMPNTRRLLAGRGVRFDEALSPHPLCCPARAEFVSGQYAQNNGVHHNTGAHGGYPAFEQKANTLGPWLQRAGYQTAMVGKYMNGYRPDRASRQGWDHWNPTVEGVYSYRHTTFFDDGKQVLHRRHVDDVTVDYARRYVREFAGRRAPFFLWVSALAPHTTLRKGVAADPRPADRHEGTLAGVPNTAAAKPSYGVRTVDGPGRRMDARARAAQQRRFQARIESLRAVDEGVRDLVATLRRTGELERTYLFFTTDNGYLLGEHGMTAKNHVQDEALRVPLLVRVPGRSEGVVSDVPVTTVDLTATFVDLAGARAGRRLDGRSFLPLLRTGQQAWRDTQLIQTGRHARRTTDQGWAYRGVRTARWTYARGARSGIEQLYDRVDDPFELVNLAGRPEYLPVLRELRSRTRALVDCAGRTCRQSFGPVPEPATSP